MITLLLPLSSAADSWLYFNYLQNEAGHSVPLESILFHCVILLHYMHEKKVLERLYKWPKSTMVHEHCTEQSENFE
jgi:hypothetical protein